MNASGNVTYNLPIAVQYYSMYVYHLVIHGCMPHWIHPILIYLVLWKIGQFNVTYSLLTWVYTTSTSYRGVCPKASGIKVTTIFCKLQFGGKLFWRVAKKRHPHSRTDRLRQSHFLYLFFRMNDKSSRLCQSCCCCCCCDVVLAATFFWHSHF